MISPGEVTQLLRAMKDGDPSAGEQLLPLVYRELHRLAKHYMRGERPDHTLQPTELINEAYLRLAREAADYHDRQHFIAVAATVMRRVLVDHARARQAEIRGGGLQRVDFEEAGLVSKERSGEVLLVDEALTKLAHLNPRQAKVVELRYFAGMAVEEIAAMLGIAPRSVKRDWALAKVWLFHEVEPNLVKRGS